MSKMLFAVLVLAFSVHAWAQPGVAVAEARPHATGAFDARLTATADWSTAAGVRARFSPQRFRMAGEPVDLAVESVHFVVPEGYTPVAEGGAAYGLMVWVSPTPSGRLPVRGYAAALAERDLIWVCPNNAGNPRPILERFSLVMTAAYNAMMLYDIDPERVYVGGMSGGGRSSSMLGLVYADVFRGAMPVVGCNFYRAIDVPGVAGRAWPATPPPSRAMKAIARRQPMVIVTGSEDYNREQCEVYAREFERDGFDQVTYMEVPGLAHAYPQAPEFGEALDLLDERLEPTRAEGVRRDAAQRQLDAALAERETNAARGDAMLERLSRSAIDTPAGRAARYRLAVEVYRGVAGEVAGE